MDPKKLQHFKAVKDRYLEIGKKVKKYRNQFLVSNWSGEPLEKGPMALTLKAYQRLIRLEEKLKKAHAEFIRVLRDLHK